MAEFDFKKFSHLSPTEQIEEYHKFMEQNSNNTQEAVKEAAPVKTPATQLLNKIGKKTELVIGDRTYVLAHWSPTKMYRNIPKIGRYFVIPASTVIGEIFNAQQEGTEVDLSEAIPTALMYLFQTMEDNDIMDFYKIIFEDVYLDNKLIAENLGNNSAKLISDEEKSILVNVVKMAVDEEEWYIIDKLFNKE